MEDSIKKFEKGMELSKKCNSILEDAEKRILQAYFQLDPNLRARIWAEMATNLQAQMTNNQNNNCITRTTAVGTELDRRENEEKALSDEKAENNAAG